MSKFLYVLSDYSFSINRFSNLVRCVCALAIRVSLSRSSVHHLVRSFAFVLFILHHFDARMGLLLMITWVGLSWTVLHSRRARLEELIQAYIVCALAQCDSFVIRIAEKRSVDATNRRAKKKTATLHWRRMKNEQRKIIKIDQIKHTSTAISIDARLDWRENKLTKNERETESKCKYTSTDRMEWKRKISTSPNENR